MKPGVLIVGIVLTFWWPDIARAQSGSTPGITVIGPGQSSATAGNHAAESDGAREAGLAPPNKLPALPDLGTNDTMQTNAILRQFDYIGEPDPTNSAKLQEIKRKYREANQTTGSAGSDGSY